MLRRVAPGLFWVAVLLKQYLAYAEKLALGRLVRDHPVNHAQAPRLTQTIESDSGDALLECVIMVVST